MVIDDMKRLLVAFFMLIAFFSLICTVNASFDYKIFWQYKTYESTNIEPVIAYINPDEGMNIFFASGNDIHVLDSFGREIWNYELDDDVFHMTVRDINNDKYPELIVGSKSTGVYVYKYRGDLIWHRMESRHKVYTIVQDIDLRPGMEILTASGFNITLYSSEGDKIWSFKTLREINTKPILKDLDLDGKLDVIVGANDLMYVISTPPYKSMFYQTNGGVLPQPIVFDIDRDGLLEIIYSTGGNKVNILNHSQTGLDLELEHDVERGIVTSPIIIDMGGDKVFDMIIGTQNRFLYVINSSGYRLWKYSTPIRLHYPPANADLNMDGIDEIIYPSGDTLFILNDTRTVWSYKVKKPITSSPIVKDINGDHIAEILVSTNDGTLNVFSREYYVKKSIADDFYKKAIDYYESESYFNSIAYNELAKQQYEKIGDSESLIKTKRLVLRIEANELLNMGQVYYDFGFYTNSEELSDKSLQTFKMINYREGIEESLFLKQKSIMHREAEDLIDLSKLDYVEGKFIDSRFKALQASRLYRLINYTEGFLDADSVVEDVFNKIHADSYYFLAVLAYYNKTESAEARHYLSKAEDAFSKVNDTEGLERIGRIDKRITADSLLVKAQSNYKSGHKREAFGFALDAKTIYGQLGYDIGLLKAQDIIDKSGIVEEPGKIRTLEEKNDIIMYALVALVSLLIVLLIVKKVKS